MPIIVKFTNMNSEIFQQPRNSHQSRYEQVTYVVIENSPRGYPEMRNYGGQRKISREGILHNEKSEKGCISASPLHYENIQQIFFAVLDIS